MKDIIVKNYAEQGVEQKGVQGNTYTVTSIVPDDLIDRCSANFVEVEPGEFAYGYHFHEENEEVFYIISGNAVVKTENGDINLKTGDAIAFPANKSGSHVISNPSKTEKLIYIDFGTANKPDVVHFTGANAGMVVAKSGIYNFTE